MTDTGKLVETHKDKRPYRVRVFMAAQQFCDNRSNCGIHKDSPNNYSLPECEISDFCINQYRKGRGFAPRSGRGVFKDLGFLLRVERKI